MVETGIRLNDKTVVLAGPFGLLMQNMMARLCESGADVCILTDEIKPAQRVCQNIMDQREVSEVFGRATAFELKAVDAKSVENAFSQSAEAFGTTDIYIDLNLFNTKIPFLAGTSAEEISRSFSSCYERVRAMSAVASNFIRSRSRGRMLYLFNLLDLWAAERAKCDVFNEFFDHIHKMALQLAASGVSVNALGIGVNEEYLLSRFPKNPSIQKAHQELLKTLPHAKIVDYAEISNLATFVVSPLSSGLNGQVIRMDHCL